MEYVNAIEYAGIVGGVSVRELEGNTKFVNFSLAYNHCYKNKEGEAVIETTWMNIVAVNTEVGNEVVESIKVGDNVKVVGRLRTLSYETADGERRTLYDIYAHSVEIVKESEE